MGSGQYRIQGGYDFLEGVTKMAMLRWDPDTLAWVKFTGNTAEPGANVYVTNFPAIQAVSATALPLPAGAATEAKQDLANSYLADIAEQSLDSIKQQIFAADDLTTAVTWSDFGTATQRVATTAYASATVGFTATCTFAYTNVGGQYRLDTTSWAVS